jgi:hypothetical protein
MVRTQRLMIPDQYSAFPGRVPYNLNNENCGAFKVSNE